MRRIKLLLLTLVMLFSCNFPVLAAETAENENLLPNGGFEILDENGNAAGVIPSEPWGAQVRLTDEEVYSGTKSLCLENIDGTGQRFARMRVDGLQANAIYEISGQIMASNLGGTTNKYATFLVEYYNEEDEHIWSDYDWLVTTDTNELWMHCSFSFPMREDSKYVNIYCWLVGPGLVYFDDLQLKMGEAPQKYHFTVNTRAQYADDTEGRAKVRIDDYYDFAEIAADTVVKFRLLDGETREELHTAFVTDFVDGEAFYTFDLALMKEMGKDYIVEADVQNKAGETLEIYEEPMQKFTRPPQLTKDGEYLVNGEIFNPVIGYHVSPEDYEICKQIGINVIELLLVNADTAPGLVNAAGEAGLMVIAALYDSDMVPAAHPDKIENTKRIVEAIKDNPYVFALNALDEPFGHSPTPEQEELVWESYKLFRSYAPNLPVFLLDAQPKNVHMDLKSCDIFSSEPYTMGRHTKVTDITTRVKKMADYAGKMYMAVGSTYSNREDPAFFPKASDVRSWMWRMMAAGCRGTGYYAFSDANHAKGTPLYQEALWEELKDIGTRELQMLFDLFVNNKYPVFGRYWENVNNNGYFTQAFVDGNDLLLGVHNLNGEPQEISVPLTSGNGKVKVGAFTATPVFGGGDVISGDGTFTITLDAEKPVLYRISPAAMTDFSAAGTDGTTNFFASESARQDNTAASTAPKGPFMDLNGYDWAKADIEALYGEGILTDKNIYAYAPGENVTRGDFGMYLIRTLGLTAEQGENFSDVLEEAVYAKELSTGKALGLFLGTGDNLYHPDDSISRQDIMVLCRRALEIAGKEITVTEGALDRFTDKDTLSAYAVEAAKAMVSSEIIGGTDEGKINPLGNTTRAEAAVILRRLRERPKAPEKTEETKEEPGLHVEFPTEGTETERMRWEQAAAFLANIGVPVPEDLTAALTTGDFANMLSACVGHEYKPFADESIALTYNIAVTELIDVLGYSIYEQRDGSPLVTADRIELLKGTTSKADEPIRAGVAVLLLANALEIDLCEKATFGEGADGEYKTIEGHTILTDYMGIDTYKGRLVANRFMTLPVATGLHVSKGRVAVDNKVFEAGESNADAFFGQDIIAYVKRENETIQYITSKRSVKTIKIDAESIFPEKTTINSLRYEDSDYHENAISIVDNPAVFINGEAQPAVTADMLSPETGYVEMILNDGSCADVILITTYTNRIVEKVDKTENVIYFKEGDPLEVLENVILLDASGNAGNLSSVTEGSILSVSEVNNEKSYIKAVYSATSVRGEVKELSQKEVWIGDKVYKIASSLYNSETLAKPSVGLTAKYWLDYTGQVAYVDTSAAARNYGYFITAAAGKGLDAKVTVRMLTKKGSVEYLTVADNIRIDDEPSSPAEMLLNTKLFSGKTPISQLVVYEVNDNNEILEIDIADDKHLQSVLDLRGRDAFTKVYDSNGWSGEDDHLQYTRAFHGIFGAKYRYNDASTMVFCVPQTLSVNDKDYFVSTPSKAFVSEEFIGRGQYFDLREDFVLSAVVMIKERVTETATNSPAGVITGFGECLAEDGSVVSTISLVNNKGQDITISVPSTDFEVGYGEMVQTDITRDPVCQTTVVPEKPTSIKVSDLNVGDVIMYVVDVMTNEATAIQTLFRYETRPELGAIYSSSYLPQFMHYAPRTYLYTEVTSAKGDHFTVAKPYEWVLDFYVEGQYYSVIEYDTKTGKCKAIAYDDVRAQDKIFYAAFAHNMLIGVVYR